MECRTCQSLGFFSTLGQDGGPLRPVKGSPARQRSELEVSSREGCQFCKIILQASLLFSPVAVDFPIRIRINQYSTATIHAIIDGDYFEAVKIYQNSGESSKSFVSELKNSVETKKLSYTTDTVFEKLTKDVPPRESCQESLQFIEDCYTRCITQHAECRLDRSNLPTRLIDVSTPAYKTYEPKGHERGKYIALSYCWGKNASKILSTSNRTISYRSTFYLA
jgi:hypothetical protein